MVAMRGDLQELADFTQQIHLGMQPYHEWYQEKHRAKVRKTQAKRESSYICCDEGSLGKEEGN